MRITLAVLGTAAALTLAGGCGTMGSLTGKGEGKVYGGTQLDTALISEGFAPDPAVAKSYRLERPVEVMEGCYGIVDLPFSLVADTVTLPITVPAALRKNAGDGERAKTDERDSKDE